MDFPEARKFILASYHDLPNILFVGALILGSLLGYLPLVWLALGMILNGATTTAVQMLLKALMNTTPLAKYKSQLSVTASEYQKCYVGFRGAAKDSNATSGFSISSLTSSQNPMAAPSYWMSASAFFAIFSIYNSIRVTARESKPNADPRLVSARKAFSLSTLIIGMFFLLLIFARAYTGCETLVGGTLGVVLGAGTAIGFWHLLDVCGAGKMPDILQVVGSMAPEQHKKEQPVMCVAPAEDS